MPDRATPQRPRPLARLDHRSSSPPAATSSRSSPSLPPIVTTNMDGAPPPRRPKGVSFLRDVSPGRRSSNDRRFSGVITEFINENSPLIRPRGSGELDANDKAISPLESPDEWDMDGEQETKSTWYLILLCLGGLGLQIGWSVETSYGSPYLLSLGVSKSLLALVWIAGPLSGVLVQPYVGLKSDNSRLSWGRRRPFIIGGAAATILSLMILAWAKELVGGFLGLFGASQEAQWVKTSVLLFAILFIYVLDFAINVIQAGIRAFMVDCTPMHQQEAANAWMIRIGGVGNILGYMAGNVNLPKYLPWLGGSQFKVLCAIASLIMALTVAISCSTISERDPRWDEPPETQDGVLAFFRSLFKSVRLLPVQIRRVCEVQFFAWIGWFPFLFYITTYVGQIYVEPHFEKNPNMSDAEIDKLWEEATRVGTRALLIFAITTFISSIFLPFIVAPTYEPPFVHGQSGAMTPRTPVTPMQPSTPGSMSGSGYFALAARPDWKPKKTVKGRITRYLEMLQIQSLTLRRSWLLSHLIFAGLMALTFVVRNTFTATVLVAFIGIPWTLTNWAPFALIGSEISKREAIRMRRGSMNRPASRDSALIAAGEDDSSQESSDQAGVVLGIHNVAIAAPQVIATLVSSVIFRMLQKPRGHPGDNSVAWVLRFGGICAIIAAYLTLRVHEDKDDDPFADDRSRRGSSIRSSIRSFR